MANPFWRILPSRLVVDEVIVSGKTVSSGTTLPVSNSVGFMYSKWTPVLYPPSTSAYVTAVQLASSSVTTTLAGFSSSAAPANFGQPDFARAVRVCPSTSANVTGNVLVVGTNQFGATVTDTIAMTGVQVDGNVAFKSITSVVLPATSSALTPFTIGLSNTFGLTRKFASVSACIRGSVNGTAETTAPILNTTYYTAKFNTSASSSAGNLLDIAYFHTDATDLT